jgi:hypothetical protein
MKYLKCAVYTFVGTSLFFLIFSCNAVAQTGSADPCCGNQSRGNIIVIDPTLDPSVDGVIIIIDQTPSEPAEPSIPESTDPATQTGTVPESRLDPRQP